MTADTHPTVDPKALGRLDALPGSLGKVTLCAVFTLGIATFVSVRKWLATRSAESHDGATLTKYGFRGKSKSSNGSTTATTTTANNVNTSGSGGLTGSTDGTAKANDGRASASPPQRPPLPPRNYFTIRASLHVKRHNAKMMEWFDEQLGVQLPFSQQLFELKQEERQAPLILLSFRTLREPTHRMAVTIEELYDTQTATTYCEASLARIVDCARVLGTSTTRVGSKEYPAAEYCYVDETQATVFVYSVFVVHERLAVTLQYVAPTRVRNVMPTAFYDVVRFLTFTAPSPSPSYLLVSEPRLGLGYHLPLDFLVHEGLAESDGVEDRLFTSVGAAGNVEPLAMQDSNTAGWQQPATLGHTRGAAGVASARAYNRVHSDSSSSGGDWAVPYATAMSRGGRRVGLITSYEPPFAGSGGLDAATVAAAAPLTSGSGSGSSNNNSGVVPYVWRPYLEQQVCKAVRQLGLVIGGGSDSSSPRVIFQAPDPTDTAAYANAAQTLLMEAYPLSVALGGNFSAADDGREDDGDAASVTAFSLFREVRIDVNSSYATLVPDALDAAAAARPSTGRSPPTTVKAYWSAFYVPVGTACVSFHFIASALRHTSTEFVSFCAAVMNSVSLGNHYGQAVSVLYCNIRHDVLPFRLSLPPTGMATVAEPMLADPLCVVQATYGVEKVAVTVRVFPLFSPSAGQGSGPTGPRSSTTPAAATAGAKTPSTPSAATAAAVVDGRSTSPSKPLAPSPPLLRGPAERRGTRQRSAMRQLQYLVRYYLTQFPGGVHVVSYTRTTVNAMPALLLCFQPLWQVDGDDSNNGGALSSSTAGAVTANNWDDFGGGGGGSSQGATSWADSRETMLEEEVGQLNPFAQYYAPPPPPASYRWGQPSPQESPGVPAAVKKATTTPASAVPPAGEPGREADGDSQRSQAELDDPLRVAVAVCCEGNAFLFQTTASEYTLGVAQEAVRVTATYLALIPRTN